MTKINFHTDEQGLVGRKFRLIGGRAGVFTVVRDYYAAGAIPSVIGDSDKFRTVARVADVEFIESA